MILNATLVNSSSHMYRSRVVEYVQMKGRCARKAERSLYTSVVSFKKLLHPLFSFLLCANVPLCDREVAAVCCQ